MADFWGPALRAIPDAKTDDLADERPVTGTQSAHERRSAARGWLLRGSGAWHAAR